MADRYWVGGSGNWTDTARWSITSGGSGGASVPTASDAVYIDDSSGSGSITVTINTTLANCSQFVCNRSIGFATLSGSGTSSSILTCWGYWGPAVASLVFSGTGEIRHFGSTSAYINTTNYAGWNVLIRGNRILAGFQVTYNTYEIGVNTLNYSFNADSNSITARYVNLKGGSIILYDVYLDDTGSGGATLTVSNGGTYPPVVAQFGAFYIGGSGQFNPSVNFYLGNSYGIYVSAAGAGSAWNGTPTLNFYASSGTTAYLDGLSSVPRGTCNFQAGTTFFISNFSGVSGTSTSARLSFRSTSSGSQYTLHSGGVGDTRNFSFLDVKDSIASGATSWNAFISNGCINSGNNVTWNFGSTGGAFMQFF